MRFLSLTHKALLTVKGPDAFTGPSLCGNLCQALVCRPIRAVVQVKWPSHTPTLLPLMLNTRLPSVTAPHLCNAR